MTTKKQKELADILWSVADDLRGSMSADDFRDYMLSFLFLSYLSENYEKAVHKELGTDYPTVSSQDKHTIPLAVWYEQHDDDTTAFEAQMRRKVHYIIKPEYLWNSIVQQATVQDEKLLTTIRACFRFIENESFEMVYRGLFSEINLDSEKLGKTRVKRNELLCTIITKIDNGLTAFSHATDILGDAYIILIENFAADAGRKAGEFFTPRPISTILSRIVTLDSQNPQSGIKQKLGAVLDFACGSGSLLLNVRRELIQNGGSIGKIYGQEKNVTTYNLARMNMLLHGVKDNEFELFHGDTLTNDWELLNNENPAKKLVFDAIVANPPFSYEWKPNEQTAQDFRFNGYGVAPRSAADFAFLLHGFHYLSDEGTMALILPHGVLFRGGVEQRIRTKLLKDGNIDTIIGLPAKLFYSTSIPVCIVVLKKCKQSDDVLIINASALELEGKKQKILEQEHIDKIVNAYQYRTDEERFSRCVPMKEIRKNEYNLNISRYVSTALPVPQVDLVQVHTELVDIDKRIKQQTATHNKFLKELGLDEV